MIVKQKQLERAIYEILLMGGGTTEHEAQVMAEELTMSDMMHCNSHGCLRVPQYIREIRKGQTIPGAEVKIVKETPATAVVDGAFNFGHVAARKMTEIVIEKAKKTGVAVVHGINTRHIGRVGAYVQQIAGEGLIGFITASVFNPWPMIPWGGTEARLGTNPVAWGAPRYGEDPVFMDGATTTVSEGKIRNYILDGTLVPEGWLKDADGNPTRDPNKLYADPPGSINPLGGDARGMKGFGLGLMAALFSNALNDETYWERTIHDPGKQTYNGVFMMAVDPDFFCGREVYAKQVKKHCDFIKSSKPAPGFDEVLVPGEPELKDYRKSLKEGIYLPDDTWNNLVALGQQFGCPFTEGMAKVDGLHNSVGD